MVLRKDIREMNCDSPPKADAGLKPGEFNVKLRGVNFILELLHVSSHCLLWAGPCADTFVRKCVQSGLQQGRLKKEKFCFCSGGMQQWITPVTVESIYI